MSEIKANQIDMVPVEKLVPNPRNNNKHTDAQIERLSKLIKHTGFRNPIIVSKRNGFMVAGHGRLEAAKRLGLEELPVVYQEFESEAEEYQYLTADNEIARWAELDQVSLIDNIKELGMEDSDLELFGLPELELPEVKMLDEESEDEVPTDVETRCKRGDVWILGEHRLMCGDSTSVDDVEKLMDGQAPNTMITDPPYGVKYEAGWRADAKGVKKTKREESSSLQNDDKADWYDAYVLHPGNIAYVWHASAFTDVVMDGLKRAGFEVKAQIIWNKNVHALSRSDYQWKHEPCWYAVKSGANHNWLGDRKQKTVWDVDNVMFEKGAGGKTAHPTQKPIKLYERSIINHTNPGEYIYEPFAGSGSSIIAAEKTSRRSLSMELDEHYCDVILSRWEQYTGKEAKLDGKTKN